MSHIEQMAHRIRMRGQTINPSPPNLVIVNPQPPPSPPPAPAPAPVTKQATKRPSAIYMSAPPSERQQKVLKFSKPISTTTTTTTLSDEDSDDPELRQALVNTQIRSVLSEEAGGDEENEDGDGEEKKNPDLHWKGTSPPSLTRLIKALGVPTPKERCPLCDKAPPGTPAIPYDDLNKLATFARENLGFMPDVTLAQELEKMWTENIWFPINEKRGTRPALPMIQAIDLFLHFSGDHNNESNLSMYSQVSQMTELRKSIFIECLYKKVLRNGKPRRVPRKKWISIYLKVAEEERKARKTKPNDMQLFNPATELVWTGGKEFINMQRPVTITNMPRFLMRKPVEK